MVFYKNLNLSNEWIMARYKSQRCLHWFVHFKKNVWCWKLDVMVNRFWTRLKGDFTFLILNNCSHAAGYTRGKRERERELLHKPRYFVCPHIYFGNTFTVPKTVIHNIKSLFSCNVIYIIPCQWGSLHSTKGGQDPCYPRESIDIDTILAAEMGTEKSQS